MQNTIPVVGVVLGRSVGANVGLTVGVVVGTKYDRKSVIIVVYLLVRANVLYL